MDLTNFNLDEFFGFGDDTNPLLWLIWIIPIVIFVFYGQRIQLQITSGEIKKNIGKLKDFKDESKNELINYITKNFTTVKDPKIKLDRFIDNFTIMPVDLDPGGIIPKIRHVVRSRDDVTREQVKLLFTNISDLDRTKVQTIIEIVTSLQLLYKIVNHLYLTAKKQNNYPLILPLQMMMPFIMEEATALHKAVPTIMQGMPIGDGIGPMVVGKMMLDIKKEKSTFETVWSQTDYEGRKLFLMKAEGPSATVGRPGDALESIISKNKIDIIIMIDASLKLEGEESGTIAQGFGAAIGGIGTDRFQIEEIATKNKIPVYAIVIKQSVKEAINLMTKEIADKADEVRSQISEIISENTKSGNSVLVIGVGNSIGVSQ
ncbi:MAG: DUF1512 domain-containing protein [Nitrosopumilaceae archaeon]